MDPKHKEKMTNLFGAKVPKRDELLKIITEANVLEMASPLVKAVFDLLTYQIDLLSISKDA